MTSNPYHTDLYYRIERALQVAAECGTIDGDHHKMWVIDQMVRHLTGCPIVTEETVDYKGRRYTYQTPGESDEYKRWVADHNAGEDGPETYWWDEGTPP